MAVAFQTGLEGWLTRGARRLGAARVGLLAHPASVHRGGAHAADLLREALGDRLVALFGPEHGFFGAGGPGETVADQVHPRYGIPVRSLYGDHRRPPAEWLRDLDALVVDLQDLGVRCYTYVSTLRLVLEAAAGAGIRVVVADRPIPLPEVVDGPPLDPALESFVGAIRAPLAYGMTPAETARWLAAEYSLPVDLELAPLRGWTRRDAGPSRGVPWVPPSPGIRSWDAARAYAATVFTEALPALDCDRGGLLPFQVLGMDGLSAGEATAALARLDLPGVRFHDHRYFARDRWMDGVRLTVTDARAFRPVRTGVALLSVFQSLRGADALWGAAGTREDFFDRLMGVTWVRRALRQDYPPATIAAWWAPRLRAFRRAREKALLY